jgi:hypothetical protein
MSGPQALIPHANDGVVAEPGSELDQALLFVRVSTMKMLRLQLALERRDRAVALKTVDDLVELDEWMARCAGRLPIGDVCEALASEADQQREALLHEKFGLAAGLTKRGPEAWPELEPAVRRVVREIAAEPAELEAWHEPVAADWEQVETRGGRRWLWIGAVVLLVAAAVAGALLFVGGY